MMKESVLAIDYGSKRVGCALRKKDTEVIFPWGVLKRDKTIFDVLAILVQKEEITRIVVGLPLSLRGGESHTYNQVLQFITALKKQVSIPVETIDERFTTKEALRDYVESGASVDERAAQLILETYDRRHALG
ncbi:MAG TPA: Holliday junction resolvase RuvX [Candidatus Magasanikbacteria bacterium]|nr:Holliday junction resolvase RuvX [Candidatus Magasanikbacteria bacterium]